jgi:ArsR family transcriptional regulator, lead/cadmium/zinc/bismuth-responsive transcriptional repressor
MVLEVTMTTKCGLSEERSAVKCSVSCSNDALTSELKGVLATAPELERAREHFALLADATRLRILVLLSPGRRLCVCDLSQALDMSVASTSHHLRKLRDSGILRSESDGKFVYYMLADRSARAAVLEMAERLGPEPCCGVSKSSDPVAVG